MASRPRITKSVKFRCLPTLCGSSASCPGTRIGFSPAETEAALGRNEMLRRLKKVAERGGIKNTTLHKFRHTYATRLLEDGCDIVTVQHLLGHSDLKTTRKYLSPDQERARKAVNRLTLSRKSK